MNPMPAGGHRTIELSDQIALQRRTWAAQRIGWGAMALILLLAAIGVFGGGPLSSATARLADGAAVIEYDRFIRRSAPSEIRITAAPATAASGTLEIEVGRGFPRAFSIEKILPEPIRSTATQEGTRFSFETVPGSPAEVTLSVKATGLGFERPAVRVGDAGRLELALFVYP